MYLECESALDDIMNSGQKIFYKFSKTQNLNIYFENAYAEYKENTTMVSKEGYGFSFCMKPEKILACAVYGDTLTQITIDKNTMTKENLECDRYLYGFSEDWRKYSEIRAKRIHIGKQFSMSDPKVLKECMKVADENSLHSFFSDKAVQFQPLEKMYEKLGFLETKHLVETMRPYYKEYFAFGIHNVNAFRTKLEELFPTKEGDFSFQYQEEIYETDVKTVGVENIRKSRIKENELFESLDKPIPKKTGGLLNFVNKLRRKERNLEEQNFNNER